MFQKHEKNGRSLLLPLKLLVYSFFLRASARLQKNRKLASAQAKGSISVLQCLKKSLIIHHPAALASSILTLPASAAFCFH
ncbi:hypothetical protein [Fictibacillus enclensis]|uniref:hypothetical protein n=1 Tax=Fictibacillus enclensis TaxID=1017270 RepID=UPI0025A11FDB|nr:hypothetical protein [Fictibacillus enclensis]